MIHNLAAVVTDFAKPPRFLAFDVRDARAGEELVAVWAAGLHPRVRLGAGGEH